VLLGEIVPYILVGYVQVCLILIAAHFLFHVPFVGNIGLIFLVAFVFITGKPRDGHHLLHARVEPASGRSRFLFLLPALCCCPASCFPFRGMPVWAQHIGEVLPLTHFLRIIRGVLLKGNTFDDIELQLWQIAVFAFVALTIESEEGIGRALELTTISYFFKSGQVRKPHEVLIHSSFDDE